MLHYFLFFALTLGQLFSYDAVIHRIMTHPGYHYNCGKWVELGRTKKNRPVYAVYIKGKPKNRPIYISGGIHGNEKMSVVVTANLIVNLCKYHKHLKHPAVVIPVLNPDGYSKKSGRCRRGNGECKDINRDAFNWRTPEGKAWLEGFNRFKPIAVIDLHMPGNILLAPRPWVKGYKASQRLILRLKTLGLNWRHRDGHPKGMLISYAASQGVPAAIVEMGWRKTDGLQSGGRQYQITHKVSSTLLQLCMQGL